MFTEKVTESVNVDKRLEIPDGVQHIPKVTSAGIVCKNEIDRTCKNKKLSIMINFNDMAGENKKEHNIHCPQILDHPYKILMVSNFG